MVGPEGERHDDPVDKFGIPQAYLVSRPQRLEVARIFKELGVKGKQLGQVMRDLHTLATGNAKPRRK